MANIALKFISDHAAIYFNIANILGKKGKYEEAEIQFKLAISKNPVDPMIYANLGITRKSICNLFKTKIYKINII